MKKQKEVVVALDGSGNEKGNAAVVSAVNFALTMYPSLRLLIFGSSSLLDDLKRQNIDPKRYEFHLAQQTIPQDESPRAVIKGYPRAAMRYALEAVRDGEAQSAISGGGTGPLVALSRHILGTIGNYRPALAARIPVSTGKFALMLDLGANSAYKAQDLCDFACLGQAMARLSLNIEEPRIALLNIGIEEHKGPAILQEARSLIKADRSLYYVGFLEANRIFCGDADVIVTDGFTGNIALKAAEGVATLLGRGAGVKRFFARMARPEWLMPWQYNGSLLLGVNGTVVKSHNSAGNEAMAVAMVEAAKAALADFGSELASSLKKS